MRTLLYIGHRYHDKTKSTRFLIELLQQQYDVTELSYDPYSDNENFYKKIKNKHYNTIVCFQLLPPRSLLEKSLTFDLGVFFPMYDGGPDRKNPIWQDYYDFLIINFSKTIHKELLAMGMNSRYIQYFPEPKKVTDWGHEDSVFFWNRVEKININTVATLLKNSTIQNLYIHNALDPQQQKIKLKKTWNINITETTWFESKQEFLSVVESSALYIAPRLYEGIGMSFLEAMAMGRCVIAPNHPTMNEYIVNGFSGLLYDIENVSPLQITNIRKIQKNAHSFIQEGNIQWQKNKKNILKWMEEPKKIKTTLLFDATILLNGIINSTGRTGIYFTAYNIFNELIKSEKLQMIAFCKKEKIDLLCVFFDKYFPGYEIPIICEESDFAFIDAFLSPLFKIPECIRTKKWISKFTILYDTIILSHPEYFTEAPQPWFFEMLDSITSEDFYFSISEYTAQDFIKHVPALSRKQITVTPLAANSIFHKCNSLQKIETVRQKFHIPSGTPYLLSLCALDPRKNLIMAVRAFLEFKKKYPKEKLVYVLSGESWKNSIESIKHEIPELEQCKDVIFTGYVEDEEIVPLYSGAEFFVYTSLYEGFGLPVLEAMQCGLPVIASNTTSLPEVVGDSAISISPNSLEEHIQAFELLHFNVDLRSHYTQKGIERANLFSWAQCAQLMENKIIEVTNCVYPKITIITIVRNIIQAGRSDIFEECVHSVQRQCYNGDIEHIVIDGASTDGTISLLEEYRKKGWVIYFSEPDSGIYDAMNKGISRASGDFITFLNSDDSYSHPLALSCCAKSLYKNNSDYCYGDTIFVCLQGNDILWKGNIDTIPFGVNYCHQTMFVKRELLKQFNGFDLSYKISADSDLMIRLFAQKKKAVYVNLAFVRYHEGGISSQNMSQCHIEHATAFYRWIGKQCGLSLQDCLNLRNGAYLALPWPELLNLATKLEYKGWIKEILVRYFHAQKSTSITQSFTAPSLQFEHINSVFFRLTKYRLLSYFLVGKKKKYYYNKYRNIKENLRHGQHFKYYLFGIPVLKKIMFSNVQHYEILGCLPIMTIYKYRNKNRFTFLGIEFFKFKRL